MAIQRSVQHLPTQFFHTAVAIGAVMLACQAQAAAPRSQPQAQAPRQIAQVAQQQQQPLFDRNEHGGNDRDRSDSHGDRDHGRDMNDHNEGPRGRPPIVRPPIHPHPPPPVIVVPPCKRGGPGITPC